MCGRFALATNQLETQLAFPGFVFPFDMPRRYNIAPGQPLLAIPNRDHKRVAAFTWGLIPAWSKDPQIGSRMINARSETLAEKPSFRASYKRRRCLIPATGFFEWQKQPDGKTRIPTYISLKSGLPFAFAGLWDHWTNPEGDELETCTILTTKPNALLSVIHDRMPVILPKDAYEVWLDPAEKRPEELQGLLVPFSAEAMRAYPVSSLVNSPINDVAECLKPVDQPAQGNLF
ncbi:MAG: SOS response-associated peptidase [bacterium]|nr:SOS response-associated peptidase [bacterium]